MCEERSQAWHIPVILVQRCRSRSKKSYRQHKSLRQHSVYLRMQRKERTIGDIQILRRCGKEGHMKREVGTGAVLLLQEVKNRRQSSLGKLRESYTVSRGSRGTSYRSSDFAPLTSRTLESTPVSSFQSPSCHLLQQLPQMSCHTPWGVNASHPFRW